MTWTYSGNPGASNLDALRFLIGDTDSTNAQFTDEELNYLLEEAEESIIHAGLAACVRLIAKYTRYVDQKTGDIDIKYSQRLAQLHGLHRQLREGLTPEWYFGGISQADIEAVQEDEDRQGPIFALGMMDNPTTEPDTHNTGGTGGIL